MTLADRVTSARLVLAPLFYLIYHSPGIFPGLPQAAGLWTVSVLWIIFVVSEFTDFLDGFLARKLDRVSDFGKLFDPFADTLTQITYFLCFVQEGILPGILFLLVLYREFSILFVRNLMLRKGIAMGARISGKIKTITYILTIACALFASSVIRLGGASSLFRVFSIAALAVFCVSGLLAVVSFFDYISVYRKSENISKN
jgi:CDP-diacylglycerol--glycerol-3-phosphate 3-phosphatidyltransferase